MDSQEAHAIVDKELQRYRVMTYRDLQRLLKERDLLEIHGPSGASYQLEVEAVWDDRPGGNLRVFAHIDDRGLRALAPLTEDFIIAPNGSFVGERVTIFVKLLGEAVDVWRPVDADHLADDKYRVLGEIPDAEVWEFQPGDVVHCRSRDFTEAGMGLVAFARARRDA